MTSKPNESIPEMKARVDLQLKTLSVDGLSDEQCNEVRERLVRLIVGHQLRDQKLTNGNLEELCDELKQMMQLSESERYKQRHTWNVIAGSAFAFSVSMRCGMTLRFEGKGGPLTVAVFYV